MNTLEKNKKFDLKKEIGRYSVSISIILFATVIVLSYLFALEPFYKTILKEEAEVKTKAEEVNNRKLGIEQLAKLKEEIPDFPQKTQLLEKMVAAQKDPTQFLAQIEKISKDSNVALNSITPELNQSTVAVKLEVMGSYANLKSFLNNLENNLMIIDVISFSVTAGGGNVNFSVRVKAGG